MMAGILFWSSAIFGIVSAICAGVSDYGKAMFFLIIAFVLVLASAAFQFA